MQSYKDLIVWQKSMTLVENIYGLMKFLPNEEKYVLSDQMRRSAISIPSNIAEGYDRRSTKDYINFLSFARGSNSELQTQLYICNRLNFLSKKQIQPSIDLTEEISKMLNSLINKL
ncbi:MAG: four helix bundle protein [Ruminococcus sp.]|nr:four helix bundle protein [Ruminococcus sp.]